MSMYKCIQRLKIDGVIHEVGDVISLTGADERGAVLQQAVTIYTPPVAPPAPAPTPDLAELRQERDQLDQEIATAENGAQA